MSAGAKEDASYALLTHSIILVSWDERENHRGTPSYNKP